MFVFQNGVLIPGYAKHSNLILSELDFRNLHIYLVAIPCCGEVIICRKVFSLLWN